MIVHGVLESRRVKVFTPRHFHWGPIGNEPHFEEIEVNVATVIVTTLKLAEQPKPKPEPPAKERSICPYDHRKMKTEGVLWRHDPVRAVPMPAQVTALAPNQKVVVAHSRHLLTEASIHTDFRPADVYLPDEKLKKLAQELNGRRVEIVGEWRRLVIVPKSFGDLSTGTEVPAGKGKPLWVPDRDEVTMPSTRLIIWATDLKPIGPKLEPILGEPSSKTPFGNGEWRVYTIKRLPKGKDLTAVRILRDDPRESSPLNVADFPAVLDSMKPIKADNPEYKLWAPSLNCYGEFETAEGTFRFNFYIGGVAAIRTPDGRQGYATFEYPK